MRVLHVTTEYPPLIYGGLGTAVGGLVRASARGGIDAAVLLVGAGATPAYIPSFASPPLPGFSGPSDGILVHAIPHSDAENASVRFAQWWQPDVVHVHVFWLAHVAISIRRYTGTPIVYTVHSLDRAEYDIGQGPPECLVQWNIQSDLIHSADRVIALTENERDLIEVYCTAARERIRIVGNGIEDSRCARGAAKRRRSPGQINVLYSGRFVDRKGIRELLQAAPQVLEHAPATRFILAGGQRHSSGEQMAGHWLPESCYRYQDRIQFTGWLDEQALSHWYASADVLVVPSWYEPFGMVILEGMLHGLAIVASDVGGPRAILKDGATGLLCRARDASSLAEALIRVVSDHDLRIRLGRSAAHDVRARWLFRSALPDMRRVYEETVDECTHGQRRSC